MAKVRFILLPAAFFLLFSWGESSLATTPEALIRTHGEKIKYQERDGNYFEGIRPRLRATTAADLISVALKPVAGFGKDLPEFLFLRVPLKFPAAGKSFLGSSFGSDYDMPNVTVREPKVNYWLAHIKFRKSKSKIDRYLMFKWSTRAVLGAANIAPDALQLLAEDYYDILYPVLLSPSGKLGEVRYEFGIYAEERLILLKSFRIFSSRNRDLIFSLNINKSPLEAYELITISWDGRSEGGKPVDSGNYIIEFDGEVKDEQSAILFRSPSYQFQHDPALLQKK